ncbi:MULTISPECIES: undecaprenyl-diphosphate phosphatase [Pseudothermotoga]|uniref:undecaprenyl-diphosphate phosphatase n=1 Tax=Pseudothermotoga TaxID=1643951 RepID=UPI00224C19DE|nr:MULTISPECIES: undecaprenyl-diphosphate phosphatase [Pseudothermotoga]
MIQGLTEFLPVSSSGHIVLFANLLKTDINIAFAAMLHLGTLAAVFIFAIYSIIRALKNIKIIFNLFISTLPAALIGITFENKIEQTFSNIELLPIFFCTTSLLLMLSSSKNGEKTLEQMSFIDALFIGLFQALAILPGISRSGSTIAGALLLGFKREDSLSYSFLLALPVTAGAGLMKISEMRMSQIHLALTAFVVGIIALFILKKSVLTGKLKLFSYYCLLAGFLSFLVR